MTNNTRITLTNWIPITGTWTFEGEKATYQGPTREVSLPIGIALSGEPLRNGSIQTTVKFSESSADSEGRVIFGFNTYEMPYYIAGIGGHGYAYVLAESIPTVGGPLPIAGVGTKHYITPNSRFEILAEIIGQRTRLRVNGIKVLEETLPHPLIGDQVGLMAVGPTPVEFLDTIVTRQLPTVFVIMQLREPYNTLYEQVIRAVAEADDMKYRTFTAAEVYGPGVILHDIVRSITDSDVIIAEITGTNPNVFYELGYAHAIKKDTILLAARNNPLPFDISGYRVIFYDDTIKGKKEVEDNLRKHLASIKAGG